MKGTTLILIGGAEPEAPIAWRLLRSADGAELDRGLLDAGARAPGAEAAVLLLPGAEAQVRALDVPAKSEAQARAAAAYLFEGGLAAAEDVAYAVGPAQDEAGRRLVAAIGRARLQDWLERLARAGVDPDAVHLDCLVWPVAAGEVALLVREDRAIVAGGALGGFSIDAALAPAVLSPWLGRVADKPVHLVAIGAEAMGLAARLGDLPVRREALDDADGALARAALDPPLRAPNLRQGAFARDGAQKSPWAIWRFAAVLAALALLLQIVSLGVAGWRDEQAAQATLAAAEREFRAARPDVRRIVNLRAQVSAAANLAKASRSHPVIAASAPVVRVLQAHPEVRLDEVRHEGPGRAVRLRFSAPQAAAIEAAVAALRASGLSAAPGQMQFADARAGMTVTVDAP